MKDAARLESSYPRTGTAAWLDRDVRLSARLQRLGDRSAPLRAAAIPVARSADGWIWVGGAALCALAGAPEIRGIALWALAALVATGLVVKLVKVLVRRARPDGDWGGSYRRSDPHAFPSGHAARAALLAVLGAALGPPALAGVLAVWATLVAASRVVLGVHYVSDVLGGALLGLACGLLATAL